MDEDILAVIDQNDYGSFRHILGGHLPDTYDEWFKLHSQEVADHLRLMHPFREIQVYPDEFADYLRPFGRVADVVSLRNFAIEKATRYRHGSTPLTAERFWCTRNSSQPNRIGQAMYRTDQVVPRL